MLKIKRKQFDGAVAAEQRFALIQKKTLSLAEAERIVRARMVKTGHTLEESAPISRREVIVESGREQRPFIPRQDTSRKPVDTKNLAKGFERLGLSSDAAEVAAGMPSNDAKAKTLAGYLGVSPAVASKMLDRS